MGSSGEGGIGNGDDTSNGGDGICGSGDEYDVSGDDGGVDMWYDMRVVGQSRSELGAPPPPHPSLLVIDTLLTNETTIDRVKIDNPNITMEEYIRLEEEKAHRHSKVYNWETTTYGKIWDNEDVHDLRSVEIEFPAISFNDTLTSKETLLCEPMELLLHLAAQDFPIIKPGIIYSLVNEDKKNNTFSLLIIPREVILNGKQSAEENDQQTQAKIHKMWLLCPPTALTATATAAQMKQITLLIEHIEIVKDDEVAIDDIPLSTKPLVIVEYQIDKDGRIGYFKLIRAGGSSKRYSSMIMMLQNIDREV
ncbi:hypothetical protein Tco_0627554 [Tanacetum coccineum]|uniref:Uncharacterized protein n=1 Tax=Tanacetum coccineum TaxID=301880 RepID=A0ABQ4WMW1_9ASTR